MKKTKRRNSVARGTVYVHRFKSALGLIELAQTEKGVCRITLPGEDGSIIHELLGSSFAEADFAGGGAENKKAEKQLREYFAGKRRSFDFKIDLQTTEFRCKALRSVMKIPYGETRSYADIARSIGAPRAYRAVGTANAKNPLPFVIPCHRVVASDGIGGYGGGLEMKKKLLAIEAGR